MADIFRFAAPSIGARPAFGQKGGARDIRIFCFIRRLCPDLRRQLFIFAFERAAAAVAAFVFDEFYQRPDFSIGNGGVVGQLLVQNVVPYLCKLKIFDFDLHAASSKSAGWRGGAPASIPNAGQR